MPKSCAIPQTLLRIPNLEEKFKQALKLAEGYGELAASLLAKWR